MDDAEVDQVPPENAVSSSTGRAYWWVNQGESYERAQTGGYVFAVFHAKDGKVYGFRDNVRQLHQGDVLVHHAHSVVRAIGVVAALPERVHDRDGGPPEPGDPGAYRVSVVYHVVTPPLPLSEVPEAWRREEPKDGPFNRNGGIKEGYLFPLSEAFANQLWAQFGDRFPPLPPIAHQAWLFQANQRFFRLAEVLQEMHAGDEDDWLVTSNRAEMLPGQPVLLWQSGKEAGIYAVGELTSEPFQRPWSTWRPLSRKGQTLEWAIKFRYTHILEGLLPKPQLRLDPVLGNMLILRSAEGTNFKVTPEE